MRRTSYRVYSKLFSEFTVATYAIFGKTKKTEVLLPQAQVTLVDFRYPV